MGTSEGVVNMAFCSSNGCLWERGRPNVTITTTILIMQDHNLDYTSATHIQSYNYSNAAATATTPAPTNTGTPVSLAPPKTAVLQILSFS